MHILNVSFFAAIAALIFPSVLAAEPPTELQIDVLHTPADCETKTATGDKISVHYVGILDIIFTFVQTFLYCRPELCSPMEIYLTLRMFSAKSRVPRLNRPLMQHISALTENLSLSLVSSHDELPLPHANHLITFVLISWSWKSDSG